MWKCTVCQQTYNEKKNFCNECGAPFSSFVELVENNTTQQNNIQYNTQPTMQMNPQMQEQERINQLMYQQQQQAMANMMAQQQQLNEQLMRSNQELVSQNRQLMQNVNNVSPAPTPSPQAQPQPQFNIRLRNFWSLIAGIILFLALIGSEFIDLDWTDYSISEFCEELDENIDDWGEYMDSDEKLYSRICSFLNIFTIATIIVLVVGAFIDVTGFRGWTIGLTMCVLVITTLYMIEECDSFPFGLPYFLLLGGLIVGIKSSFTDTPPSKIPILRGLGNGVSDSSLNLSAVANGSTGQGEWRCHVCDTKNSGSVCKGCGRARRG